MKSTSFHQMTADRKLNSLQKVIWTGLNYLHLQRSLAEESVYETHCFSPSLENALWNEHAPLSSPSRKLCDLFWQQLPWGKIEEKLNQIHVHDSGCGSGDLGVRIRRFSDSRIKSYFGVDAFENTKWAENTKDYDFKFSLADPLTDSLEIPEGINFFMSQSAIEHFKCDLAYFRHIQEYIKKSHRPIFQVHLFPSASCLRLYRDHGVRQYNARSLQMISKLFSDFSKVDVFLLGGEHCNEIHYRYFTYPSMILKNKDFAKEIPSDYESQLKEAIAEDSGKSTHENASFYAMVIQSNMGADGLMDCASLLDLD
jgi:hypothetical protein